MTIAGMETPALLLDKIKLDRNIARVDQKLAATDIQFRPHGKSAKCIEVISRALEHHDSQITVSTLKEAEYYFDRGIEDIIYAVGLSPNKLDRAIRLVKRGANLKLLVDNPQQVVQCALSAKSQSVVLPLLVEIDCDDHRGGLRVEDNVFCELAEQIGSFASLEFCGLLTHAGGSYQAKDKQSLIDAAKNETSVMRRARNKLIARNIHPKITSVGSTPTLLFGDDYTDITEVRAGVYLFFDLVMHGLGVCTMDEIALSVVTSVIGHNTGRGQILCDAGWTALSRDRGTARQTVDYGYGQVCDINGHPIDAMIVSATNQEHGIVQFLDNRAIDWRKFPIGSHLRILPNHACATATMHRRYALCQGSQLLDYWVRFNGW